MYCYYHISKNAKGWDEHQGKPVLSGSIEGKGAQAKAVNPSTRDMSPHPHQIISLSYDEGGSNCRGDKKCLPAHSMEMKRDGQGMCLPTNGLLTKSSTPFKYFLAL